MKKRHGIKRMISCALTAVMLTTSISGTILGSDAEVQDELKDGLYVSEEELSSAPEVMEQESEVQLVEQPVDGGSEADGTADLLSDGSEAAAVSSPIEEEKVTESGLKIQVSVPEDVLPEGTVVEVADVAETEMEALTAQIVEDLDSQLAGEVVKVLAADISFKKDEISLVPGTDVKVTMIPGDEVRAELKEKEDDGLALSLVYVPAEGEAAVVAEEKIHEKTLEGISFETTLFPRYAIVATVEAAEEIEEVVEESAAEEVKEEAVEEPTAEEIKEDVADELVKNEEKEETSEGQPADEVAEETMEEETDELTDGVEAGAIEDTGKAEEQEQVTSVKVEGVRNSFYTTFTAELSGATVTASVPYYFVSTGTTMEASFADTTDYASIIARANYGKEITDLKAVNVRFTDRRGRRTFLFSVSITIELDDTGAEKYALYEPYRGWYGTELYQLSTSRSPKFNLYSYTDTYVLAGLRTDGIARASGTTKRGRTSFGLNTGDVSISVVAERNTFSGNVSMEAVPVEASAVAGVVNSILPEGTTAESIQAFDISFHNSNDGEEVEPKKDVAVTIALPLDEEAEYSLVHVKDNGEAEMVENAQFSAEGVTFSAGGFSVYVIVENGETSTPFRITYKFYNEDGTPYIFKNMVGEEADNQILKDGEVLEDVGLPVGSNQNSRFLGWYDEDGNLVPTDEAKTVTETKTIKLTATFETVYNIAFMTAKDSSNTRAVEIVKQVVYRTGQSEPLTVVTDDVKTEAPFDTQAFIGWNTEEDAAAALESPLIITGDTVLYPVFSEASWLYFDENDGGNEGGASYTAPQFVLAGGVTVEPEAPHRTGYRFDGWYNEPECSTRFTFGRALPQSKTIYAKWTGLEATYTITIRKQRVSDSVDATDAEKTYDYEASLSFSGTIGSTVTIPNVYTTYDNQSDVVIGGDSSETSSFVGFHYNRVKTTNDNAGKTIEADGSTVIDVFYDRNIITINFDYPSSSSQTQTVTIYEPAENGQYYFYNDPYDTGYYEGGTGPTPNAKLTHHRDVITGLFWSTFQVFGVPKHTHYHYNTRTGYYRVGTGPNPSAPGAYNLVTQTVSGTEYPADTTWRGLFGATFEDTGYTWPSTYEVKYYNNGNVTTNTVNTLWEEIVEEEYDSTILVFLDAFILPDPTLTEYNLRPHSTGNVPVRFYQQNIDGSYPDEAAYEVTSSGGAFLITDKYTGFKAAWYRTQSNSGWSSWYGLTNPDSEGVYYRVPQGYRALEIRFERIEYDLEFRNGVKGTPGESVKTEKVKYQAPLDAVETPSVAYPVAEDADHYEFVGWFTDPELTTFVSFVDLTDEQRETIRSNTGATSVITYKQMPANNLVLYAGWKLKGYDCALNPNGGTLREGDSYQAGVFWLQYGSTFSDSIRFDTTREGYDLVGWMISTVDGELLNVERDPARGNLRFVGDFSNWTMTDTPWNFNTQITGPVYLTAKWRSTSALRIEYDAKEGSGEPIDNNKYRDGSPAVVLEAPTTLPENKLFQGWHIVGSPETEIYTPGHTFEVNSEYAEESVITLEAVYTDVNNEDVEVTHITWYANGGVASDGTTTFITDDRLQLNKGVEIMPADTFTRDGYVFLGWARIPTTDNSGTPIDGYALEPKELTREDMYLTYEDGVFKTLVDGVWTTVTEVAADEKYPYHDLYAVWTQKFQVYYSGRPASDSKESPNPMTVYMCDLPASGKYNLLGDDTDPTAKLTPGTLYGGYYRGTSSGFVSSKDAYDGDNWTWKGAVTTNGMEITPTAGTTYYVKEVPADKYMMPHLHYTYYDATGKLGTMWFISSLDDYYYREAGFIIETNTGKKGIIKKDVTFTAQNTGKQEKVDASTVNDNCNAATDYISYLKDDKYLKDESISSLKVRQYWLTPDGIKVEAPVVRTITFNERTAGTIECINSSVDYTKAKGTVEYVGTSRGE